MKCRLMTYDMILALFIKSSLVPAYELYYNSYVLEKIVPYQV